MVCLDDERVLFSILVKVYLSLNCFQSLNVEVFICLVIEFVHFAFKEFVVRVLFIISPPWT